MRKTLKKYLFVENVDSLDDFHSKFDKLESGDSIVDNNGYEWIKIDDGEYRNLHGMVVSVDSGKLKHFSRLL